MKFPDKKGPSAAEKHQRLIRLRNELERLKLDFFLVPVQDAHLSFLLCDHDQRLQWLTGFTGSAGMCVVGANQSALFVDGRYTLQAQAQTDSNDYQILEFTNSKLCQWINKTLPNKDRGGGRQIGIDPWLHSDHEVERLKINLPKWRIVCVENNPIDKIWQNQPLPPASKMFEHELKYAGQSRQDKIIEMREFLTKHKFDAMVLTQSDNIAWLLNLRGADVPHTPIKQAFATVAQDGRINLFVHLNADQYEACPAWLGDQVRLRYSDEFVDVLDQLEGRVFVADTSNHGVVQRLANRQEVELCRGDDPCDKAKAQKNKVQIAGFEDAHRRDGVAMVEFLTWLDNTREPVSEIDAADKLLACRRQTGCLHDESFDAISASGPNAAIIHYRVTAQTNRQLTDGELYLIDSGGQYFDGTTDITRTVAIGCPSPRHIKSYTLLLRGLISLSSLKWPQGVPGNDLDVLSRQYLWREQQMDYAHGTGHGVGHFLGVHEGPYNITKKCKKAITNGMVLSIEPGCYVEDDYGIRLENLVVVENFTPAEQKDPSFLQFKTLTQVPFDRRLIDLSHLTSEDKDWIDSYHLAVATKLHGHCSVAAQEWLEMACKPLA